MARRKRSTLLGIFPNHFATDADLTVTQRVVKICQQQNTEEAAIRLLKENKMLRPINFL
jgi:hypothetical protein